MASSNPFEAFAFQATQINSPDGLPTEVSVSNSTQVTSHRLNHKDLTLTNSQPPSNSIENGSSLGHGSRQPKRCRTPMLVCKGDDGTTAPVSKQKRQQAGDETSAGPANGLPEKLGCMPLRLILVGHNPSDHAWRTGHYYSNPSNRMWPILLKTGIAPPGSCGCEADDTMPETVGVGFTDVGSGQPGTDSSKFTSKDFMLWRGNFYNRLLQHARQASQTIGCTCGLCGAPAVVAFTGKRHYMELLNLDATGNIRKGKARINPATVHSGKQPSEQLPVGWPLPADRTELWVLTSTSGAAPMSNADRERPYAALASRLQSISWPRTNIVLSCSKLTG